MEKGIALHLYIIFITLALLNCNTTEPPVNGKEITLKLADVSCTEVWITLVTTNLQLPAAVTLKQSSQGEEDKKSTINLSTADTLLYIDSLLPNTSYQYQVSSIPQSDRQNPVSSNEITTITMDTTSNDFTFTTYTFGGQAGSCALYDVAIIDENNIWAVGEIYLLDSLGLPDPLPYNALHWNGISWELKRIKTYFRDHTITTPLDGIFAFTATDIWLVGSLPIHGDGTNWQMYDVRTIVDPNLSLSKVWGTSTNYMYFVGRSGSIAHYQNGVWNKIESGTTTIINDIWGIINNQDKIILYCPVSSFFVPGDKKILKITDDKVDSVSWNRDVRLYSSWTSNENFLYVCGEGAYVNKFGNWSRINLPDVGMNSVRGNNINDIFIAGDFGFITHFNGVIWKTLTSFNDKGYSEVTVKGNIVAICGNYKGLALIEICKRN